MLGVVSVVLETKAGDIEAVVGSDLEKTSPHWPLSTGHSHVLFLQKYFKMTVIIGQSTCECNGGHLDTPRA